MWRDSKKAKFFTQFLSVNQSVGGHFRRKGQDSEELIEEEEEEMGEAKERGEDDHGYAQAANSNMHLAHRQNLSMAFYCHEVILEMEERGHTDTTLFGPKD